MCDDRIRDGKPRNYCEFSRWLVQGRTGFPHTTGDRMRKEESLHAVLFTADDVTCDWAKIIRVCETNHVLLVAIEIQAAMAVKKAIANALIAIGQAGEEEFDYYGL